MDRMSLVAAIIRQTISLPVLMSRTPHDQFAKELLAGLLETVGLAQTEVNVTSEVRRIDLLFVPLPEKAEFRKWRTMVSAGSDGTVRLWQSP
jgi:hypothetical protein